MAAALQPMDDLPNLKLRRALALHQEIETVKDLDVLLERILSAARALIPADAGSFFTVGNKILEFQLAQNDTLQRRLPQGQKLPFRKIFIPLDHASIAGHVALTGKTLNIDKVYAHDFSAEPFSFNPIYDQTTGYHTESLLTIPLKIHDGRVIGVMQLLNALDAGGKPTGFADEDIPLVAFFASRAAGAVEHAAMTRFMILRMIEMARLRDPHETGPHANRVGAYAAAIYARWAVGRNLPAAMIERDGDTLRMAAMLHDVGKVGVADHILKKPGRLSPAEFAEMQQHTTKGAALFRDRHSDFDDMAAEIALNHHEKWDGTGYPAGRRGADIPLFGRIVAAADVFDALSNRRAYKPAWPEAQVLDELKKGSGTHFDPEVIEAFLTVLEDIRAISTQFPDKGEADA
jgi:HD-GYP domain-containing protein (c-di-GMP phosphodiesterase class II)